MDAIKFIEIYNRAGDSFEFTKALYDLKTTNNKLYNEVIEELKNGKYKVKYLNSYWGDNINNKGGNNIIC